MEFIIVLPIYFVFLGMAFFFGELSLQGVNMTASGDRTIALTHGRAGTGGFPGIAESQLRIAKAISPFSNRVDQAVHYRAEGALEKVSQLTSEQDGLVADDKFRGAWSWLVAATLKDNYAMTPWTRGFVMPWRVLIEKTDVDAQHVDAGVDDLMDPGRIGRTEMLSRKLGNVKCYAYYTLTRKHDGFHEKSYRRWGTGRIVDSGNPHDATWYKFVYREPFPVQGENGFDAEQINHGGRSGQGVPSGVTTGERRAYKRYEKFVTWSE